MVKLLKIALLGPYLGKNWASMGCTQHKAQFFLEITEIISFQELFISSKIKSYE